MSGHAATGIDDNLPAGQTTVTDRAADDKVARGIDEILGAGTQPVIGQHWLDDFFHNRFVQVFL